MTIKELKDKIELLPEDWIVILSSDEEGNSFHNVDSVEKELSYDDDGEISIIDPDDISEYEDGDLQKVIVLWP